MKSSVMRVMVTMAMMSMAMMMTTTTMGMVKGLEGHQPRDDGPHDDDDDAAEDHGASRVGQRGAFDAFQYHVRVLTAKRAEGNQCTRGLKTQRAMVKPWEVC